MRVLFVTGEFPPMQGGVGDCTNELGKALTDLGAQVCVVTSKAAKDAPASTSRDLEIRPLVDKWNWLSLGSISKTVGEFSPDIVHIQFQIAAFGMRSAIYFLPHYLSLKRAQARLAVTFHDLRPPYLFPKAGLLRNWVTRELAHSSDAVVVTNDADYGIVQAWNLKQLSLIPIGSNISTTSPASYHREAWRAQLGVGENEKLLCYFGFLNESKGGETLMRALALVPKAKLLMIGGQTGASDPTNAAYLARVKELICELGLSDRVIWTDYTPAEIVTANFFASDICVLPYRDGASYRRGTLMAALAHGMAIVTTTAHELRAIYESSPPRLLDSTNCLLVPPDDPGSLASAINRASISPDLLAKIRTGASQLAQHFTWDKIGQMHLDLYKEMLKVV